MKMADGGFRPAFNIQLAVDVDTQLVLGVDVVNLGSDRGQMHPMYERLGERQESGALHKWRAATVECVHAHERRR